MKRFLVRIIICVVPTLLSIGVVAWAYNEYQQGRGGFTLGVDLAGGTILVYEVDPSKTKDKFEPADLAAALKRRIDPADLYNITIRPVPTTPPRVEIILPTGGRHQARAEQRAWEELLADAAEQYPVEGKDNPYADIRKGDRGALVDAIVRENSKLTRSEVDRWVESKTQRGSGERRTLTGDDVDRIKNLIAKQGRLEFRILANTEDDAEAINAAIEYFKKADKAELAKLEVKAEPPPAPRREDGSEFFPVKLTNEPDHTYSWVELGKSQLYSMKLNSDALERNSPYKVQYEEALKSGVPFKYGPNLIYVRKITDWSRRLIKDREQGKKVEFFVLVRNPLKGQEITGDYLVRASEGHDKRGARSIDFLFNAEGGNRFYEVTSRNKPSGGEETGFKRQLAIIFDGQIMSAPSLLSPIRTSGQITGEFTQEEVNEMVRILRAGALPATLKKDPVSENTMGPTLGADTIKWGTYSVIGAFIAVLAFMIFYYRFAGIIACIALFANLIITVAFMILVQAAFTLPGLAGLVLTLGMAVDANILIYERLREERDRGASLSQALRNGYERAIPTILDTHLTSIVTAIVLYVVGNDQLKGFGISLTAGLLISLFTSLYITRTIFEIGFYKGWVKDLGFYQGLVNLIHIRYWDFMSIRHYWFAATAVLTLAGTALFIYRADSNPATGKTTVLNIDFTGGVAYTGRLNEPMTLEDLRRALEGDPTNPPLPDLSIEQIFVSEGGLTSEEGSRFFTLRTSKKEAKEVLSYISDALSGKLKQLYLADPKIVYDVTGKKAIGADLRFTNEKDEPDYASQAQVQRLVGAEFEARNLSRNAFTIDAPEDRSKESPEYPGRYSLLHLRLSDPMDADVLKKVLTAVQEEFRSSPQPERLEIFDSQLAASTQQRALYAILASWAAILLYLWFRFGNWTFGIAAVVCLIHDVLLTLGVIAACHYFHAFLPGVAQLLKIQDFKIDLQTVAALLTLVGYSVNDTIVVFDRIREVRGKNPALTTQMINDSINQTLTRTLLASATVFLVVLVLYWFGGEGVHLFAFVMIIGVIVGTYSSIFVASPLLLIFGEGRVSPAQLDRAPTLATAPSTGIRKG